MDVDETKALMHANQLVFQQPPPLQATMRICVSDMAMVYKLMNAAGLASLCDSYIQFYYVPAPRQVTAMTLLQSTSAIAISHLSLALPCSTPPPQCLPW